ncbi:DUF2974 domain-containing protein [Treponema vincentii]|uniref:Mbeg1-like protein n=1 Tax=Treponema vincentii TaxID=69710 RepID=UPI0020A61C29|nr:Mbeg1-like protein [Treponema vincentii]UTC46458.1 DUF2974 domain-containing protein [Treponema vincentii]
MANLSDYVQWRGDLSFEVRPFNKIDALVLCQLSYLNFSGIIPGQFNGGITLGETAHTYAADSTRGIPQEFGVFINPLTADLLKAAAETERFGSILLKGFVNEVNRTTNKQFAALTAVLPTGDVCIVYRGTDDSLIGWKEDCLLCLQDAVPSHSAAVQYLSAAASAVACGAEKLSIAGHSKGGNLALYAAGSAAASIRERIERIFCFDGPGFAFDIKQWDGFQAILPKTASFIPQSSVVGVLLSYFPYYTVIESSEANTLWQHDAFSWQIKRDEFVIHQEGRTKESYFAEKAVQTWLSRLDDTERKEFITTLFEVMFGTGAETLSELTANGLAHSLHILQELHTVDSERRKELFAVIKSFFGAVYTHFPYP